MTHITTGTLAVLQTVTRGQSTCGFISQQLSACIRMRGVLVTLSDVRPYFCITTGRNGPRCI